MMEWASAVSDKASLEEALEICVDSLRREFAGESPDLAVAFVSHHHSTYYDQVPALLKESLGSGLLFGCSAGGVIGGGREVEHRPGVSLTWAKLPGVELETFHLESSSLPDLDAGPDLWQTLMRTSSRKPDFLLLSDPFTFPTEKLLQGLDYAFPGSVKIGGMASGAERPEGNVLYLGDRTYRSGAIGIAMQGNLVVDTVVAQGCRPIGSPMQITGCRRNLLVELEQKPTFQVIQELYHTLSPRDQELFRHSLFLGIAMDELKEEHRQGDFLMRNLVGIDPERKALAIGEMLHEGQVVQFHLRDAQTSEEDLRLLLASYTRTTDRELARGALLFSCLGRGVGLYGRPDHDTDLFRDFLGNIPLGGFFCNGEIGPVGGTTYLHGYTSSFALFRSRTGPGA